MSFRLVRDGSFNKVVAKDLLTQSKPAEGIPNPRPVVSSGTYDIAFQQAPWVGATIFVNSVGYMCISGIQHTSVSGFVTIDPASAAPGTLIFTMPFGTSGDTISGVCVCHSSGIVVPSFCTCTNGSTSINIQPSAPVTRIDYSVIMVAEAI